MKPVGSPVAANVSGSLSASVAVTVRLNAVPTVAVCALGAVSTGDALAGPAAAAIVRGTVTGSLDNVPSVAVSTTWKVPLTVGVPLMTPAALSVSPVGNAVLGVAKVGVVPSSSLAVTVAL